jgi:hypothetical protein
MQMSQYFVTAIANKHVWLKLCDLKDGKKTV